MARCSAGCSWLGTYGLFVMNCMNFMDLKFEPFHILSLIQGLLFFFPLGFSHEPTSSISSSETA